MARRGPRLVVVSPASSGLPAGVEIALAGRMTLGRDDASSIVIADASVSGQHAVLEQTRDGWYVRDLGSTNGTFVNGRALDGRPAPLRDNTQLAFGTVVFRFRA
jgi:pSer/pThr/pTyr-binding forkhead associated (FHA) protein